MYSTVNFQAVLASAVASLVIGSIWFGPLFGKTFMNAMGMSEWSPEQQASMKKAMAVTYIAQFIAGIVMFYVLGIIMNGLGLKSLHGGIECALLLWIGFVVPLKLGDALWGGKMVLFWLGSGNMLLTLLASGAIIGVWS